MSDLPRETRAFRGIPLPVIAVALAVGATLLGDSMLYAVMPSRPEAWALSVPAVGILLSVNRLVRLVTNSVAAWIIERFGQRVPFVAALLLAVAGHALLRLGHGVCGAPGGEDGLGTVLVDPAPRRLLDRSLGGDRRRTAGCCWAPTRRLFAWDRWLAP